MASARVEVRADAREVERRADERFADAASFRRVVVGVAARIFVARSAVRFALVHELGCDDLAVAQLHAVAPDLFVDDRELVALAHVLNEVDVPLEDARHVHRDLVGHARRDAGFEQRRLDHAVSAARANVEPPLERRRLESRGCARDGQDLHVVELAAQRQDLTVAMRNRDAVARLQQLESGADFGQRHELGEVGETQAVAAEQLLERVAAWTSKSSATLKGSMRGAGARSTGGGGSGGEPAAVP